MKTHGCPHCGHIDLALGESVTVDGRYYVLFRCPKCGKTAWNIAGSHELLTTPKPYLWRRGVTFEVKRPIIMYAGGSGSKLQFRPGDILIYVGCRRGSIIGLTRYFTFDDLEYETNERWLDSYLMPTEEDRAPKEVSHA